MTINYQREITLTNKCNAIYDDELLINAILWAAEAPVQSKKSVFMSGKYPCVSVGKKKYHIHRLIYMYLCGEFIDSSFHIHHKDHNKMNASVGNLKKVKAADHISWHGKGKTLTEEHRRKIAEAGRRRVGIKLKRKYNIDPSELSKLLSEGWSISRIARKYGCDRSVIKQRISEHPHLLEKAS